MASLDDPFFKHREKFKIFFGEDFVTHFAGKFKSFMYYRKMFCKAKSIKDLLKEDKLTLKMLKTSFNEKPPKNKADAIKIMFEIFAKYKNKKFSYLRDFPDVIKFYPFGRQNDYCLINYMSLSKIRLGPRAYRKTA